MILLMDGFLAIFVLFNILFSLRATFWEYLQAVLSYAIPYILLSIFLGPVYQWGLSQNFVPSFIAKLSPNNYHLVYYFGLKLALFIILVLLCKIVFHFTIGKILGKQRKSPKKGLRFLTNLPIALLFALSFSAWLVFFLARLGVPYEGTVTEKTLKYGENYFEAVGFYDERHALEVLEALDILEENLRDYSYRFLDEDFVKLTKPLFDGLTALKEKLSDSGKAMLSGNDWQDVHNLLFGGLKDTLLAAEAANEKLGDIKGILKDLKDYEKIVQAYHTLQGLEGTVTSYKFYAYLKAEGITVNIRKIDKAVAETFAKIEDFESLKNFTVNYLSLPTGFTETEYLESVEALMQDPNNYANFLLTLSQEFPSGLLQISVGHLEELSLFAFDNSSALSLKEQYLYQNIYSSLQKKLTKNTWGHQYAIALMDDLAEKEVFPETFWKFTRLDHPEWTETDLTAYLDGWKITSGAKEKLVSKLNLA